MRRMTVVLAAVVASWVMPAPAGAVVVAAVPGSYQTTYATPVAVAPTAAPLFFVNGDIQPHDVVALEDFLPQKEAKKAPWCENFKQKTKKKKVRYRCPVFWSEVAETGEATEIQGVDGLESGGDYAFYCTIHPRMRGTLVAL